MKRNRLVSKPSRRKSRYLTSTSPKMGYRFFALVSATVVVLSFFFVPDDWRNPEVTDSTATVAETLTKNSSPLILPGQSAAPNDRQVNGQYQVIADDIASKSIEPIVPKPVQRVLENSEGNIISTSLDDSLEESVFDTKANTPLQQQSLQARVDERIDKLTLAAVEEQPSIKDDQMIKERIQVKSGDNLSLIFARAGLSARDVYQLTQLGKNTISPLLKLRPGQILEIATTKNGDGTPSLARVSVVLSPTETFIVNQNHDGFSAQTLTREVNLKQKQITGHISSSLFESGLVAGLSDKTIMELAYIFGWDIDFALDLRKGDHYKLIFNERWLDGEKIGDGEILAAEFTNRGKTFRALRFVDEQQRSRYYSPEGESMRKSFTRTPVPLSRISSRFNPNRKHPILKINRPHRGVDYAAKTGTPILATGDGRVEFVGRKGGYGRTIILSHGGKYTTLYAHMSRFRKGLSVGKRVIQGQTIGYVGMSGTATGPHLHYEFRVNGVHRNPLTVKLPKAEPLPERYRQDFDRLSEPLIAQLDSLTATNLAQKN